MKTQIKKLAIGFLILIIFIFLLPSISLSANKSQQFQIVILPPKIKGDTNPWIETAFQKSIEFTLESVSLYGAVDEDLITDKYREIYVYTNPLILGNEKLAEFGDLFHGDYLIAGEITSNDSSNYYEIKIKIIEVASGNTIKTTEDDKDYTIFVKGNDQKLFSIGDHVFEVMVNHHQYEPSRLEEAVVKNQDFKVNPNSSKAWCLGYIKYRNSKYYEAKDLFVNSKVGFPDFSESLRMIARINTVLGQYELAQRNFQDAVKAGKQNFRTWNDIALFYTAIESYSQAENSYSNALQLRKQDVDIYTNIGDLNYKLGNYGLAKDWYLNALELYDLNVRALEGIIKISAYKSKNWDDTFSYADRLLSIDDRNYVAYTALANYFATKKDYYNALNMAIEALLIDQTLGGTYLVGLLYLEYYKQTNKIEHFNEAIRALEYCLNNDYNIPDIYVTIAKAYALVYNGDKAAVYLERAFENGFTDIDSIIFGEDFENVKDNPKFKEVISKWYAILKGDD